MSLIKDIPNADDQGTYYYSERSHFNQNPVSGLNYISLSLDIGNDRAFRRELIEREVNFMSPLIVFHDTPPNHRKTTEAYYMTKDSGIYLRIFTGDKLSEKELNNLIFDTEFTYASETGIIAELIHVGSTVDELFRAQVKAAKNQPII